MKMISSNISKFAERLAKKVREAAERSVRAAKQRAEDAIFSAGVKAHIVDTPKVGNVMGFEVWIGKAVDGGKGWDIKPGMLAKALSRGKTYVDVPIHLDHLRNSQEIIASLLAQGVRGLSFGRGGAILFRRLSINSPVWTWLHPGFGGDTHGQAPRRVGSIRGPSAPRQLGTGYGPPTPLIPSIGKDLRSSLAGIARAIPKVFRDEVK